MKFSKPMSKKEVSRVLATNQPLTFTDSHMNGTVIPIDSLDDYVGKDTFFRLSDCKKFVMCETGKLDKK